MEDQVSGMAKKAAGAGWKENVNGTEHACLRNVLTKPSSSRSSDVRTACFWHILLILYILFIYSHSMRPAVQSSAESGRVLRLLQELAEKAGIAVPWLTEHIVRKCAHFIEYTGLGILLRQSASYIKRDGNLPENTETLPALEQRALEGQKKETGSFIFLELHRIAIFAVPFVDETIQLFTEGRSGQISDVWLDMAGALTGTVLYLVMNRIYLTVRRR